LIGFDAEPSFFQGRINGKIIDEMRGTNGFGYDPVFIPDGLDITFAQMQMEQKNRISHRAIAVKNLITYLRSLSRFQ
jgi:XTP/dITP diphosphohydrolase